MRFFKRKAAPSEPVKSPFTAKLSVVKDTEEEFELVLQAATLGEIAELYQVSRPTAKKWIEPIKKSLGKIIGRTFTVRQVEKIIRFLGIPGKRLRMTAVLA